MLRRFFLIASLTLSALLLPAGCPTDPSGGDNSNSAANENGSTGNTNGSNENGGGSENENGADNANGSGGTNENGSGGANENSNSSGNSNENGDTPGPSIVAAWSGSLACERTQALSGGNPGNPTTSSQSLAITFGSDNKPTSIVILGYSGFADQTVTLKNAGDTVTNSVSANNYNGTMQMTIASVDYRADRCEIVVDIVLQSATTSGNNATQNGTGRQTITARTVGDGLEYTAESSYEVRLEVSSFQIDTTEVKICTGTLSK